MSRQSWRELITWQVADSAAIASSAAEALLFPNITIPANYLQDGRQMNLRCQGKHSTTATPTLIFRVRLGGLAGVLLALSPTFTTGSGMSNKLWEIDLMIQTRANGSSGSILVIGDAVVQGSTVPGQLMCVGGDNAPAGATVDLTADQALSVTAQWGTSSASNTITGMNYGLSSDN